MFQILTDMRTVSRGDRGKLLVSTHYMLNALKFCNIIVKGTIKLSFLVLLPMATSSLKALPLYYSRNLNYIYTLVVEIFFLHRLPLVFWKPPATKREKKVTNFPFLED